jgi:hypothetical protein
MQLELFNYYKYDQHLPIFREIIKTSPLKWNLIEIENLPKLWLKAICIKFKLPYSGNRYQLFINILNFIDLARLVKDNFDQDPQSRELTLKEKPPYKIKDIKPVLKKLNIRHSWLRKKEKLNFAKDHFVQRWTYKPNWKQYNL